MPSEEESKTGLKTKVEIKPRRIELYWHPHYQESLQSQQENKYQHPHKNYQRSEYPSRGGKGQN